MNDDFDIPLHQLRRFSINDEDVTELANRISMAGTKANEAADSLRRFNRSLLSTHTAAVGLSMEFGAVEQRMLAMMRADAGGGLLNPGDLYGPGEWREVGKKRARKLRRRGEHVEPTFLGYRWWRPLRRK